MKFDGGSFQLPAMGGSNAHANWVTGADGKPALLLSASGRSAFIGNISSCYLTWHPEIIKLADENPAFRYAPKNAAGARKSAKETLAGQMVNLLAYHPDICFTREDLDEIGKKLASLAGLPMPGDVIQLVNKTDQFGLKRFKHRVDGVAVYQMPRIEFDGQRARVRGAEIRDRDWKVRETARAKEDYKRLSEGSFEVGHKDPRIRELGEHGENAVIQPQELNRAYRDRYIFDDVGRPRRPVPEELERQISSEETPEGALSYVDAVVSAALEAGVTAEEIVALVEKAAGESA